MHLPATCPQTPGLKTTFASVMKSYKRKLRASTEWPPARCGSCRAWAWTRQGEDKATDSSKQLDPMMTGLVPSCEFIYFPWWTVTPVITDEAILSPHNLSDLRSGTLRLQQQGAKALCCTRGTGMLLRPPAGCVTCLLCFPGTVQW